MGLPIARHLVAAGFPVTVCDVDPGRRGAAEQLGAASTSTVDDLGSRPVALAVGPPAADAPTAAGQYGAVAADGSVLVVCSSMRTATCVAVERALRPAGVRV